MPHCVTQDTQHSRRPDLAWVLMPAKHQGFRLRDGRQRRYSGPHPGIQRAEGLSRDHVPPPDHLSGLDQAQRRSNDPVLHAFLEASDPGVADHALAGLLQQSAQPLIAGIVGQKIRQGGRPLAGVDADDVTADVLARVVARLVDLRSGHDAEPIVNFSGYVAVAAYNGWHHFLRTCFPERARLKNRLRYIASRHPALATWADADGRMVCGLRTWHGRARSSSAVQRLRGVVDDAGSFADKRGYLMTGEVLVRRRWRCGR